MSTCTELEFVFRFVKYNGPHPNSNFGDFGFCVYGPEEGHHFNFLERF